MKNDKRVMNSFSHHYAKIPKDLYDRLKAAEDILRELQTEIESYRGRKGDQIK